MSTDTDRAPRFRSFRPQQYADAMGIYKKTVYNWLREDKMPRGVTVEKFPSGNYRLDVDLQVHPWMPHLELDGYTKGPDAKAQA